MAYQKVTLAAFPKADLVKTTRQRPRIAERPDLKKKKAIAIASDNGRCWWIAQYLRHNL